MTETLDNGFILQSWDISPQENRHWFSNQPISHDLFLVAFADLGPTPSSKCWAMACIASGLKTMYGVPILIEQFVVHKAFSPMPWHKQSLLGATV